MKVDAEDFNNKVALLKWIESADPIKDAQDALEINDHRLMAVYGFVLTIPGVQPDKYIQFKEFYGVKPIKGTSDHLANDEHVRLNKLAIAYSLEYNKIILNSVVQ